MNVCGPSCWVVGLQAECDNFKEKAQKLEEEKRGLRKVLTLWKWTSLTKDQPTRIPLTISMMIVLIKIKMKKQSILMMIQMTFKLP